jgi:polysaccharide biosynthesis protein VpsJ
MSSGTAAVHVGDLRSVIARTDSWLRTHEYSGYDPYDLLNASRLPAFSRATKRRRQLVIQLGKRSPLNPRPLLGVPRQQIGKALALVVSGYAQLQRLEPDPAVAARAESLLSQLDAKRLTKGDKASWGYEFDVQTRWAFYRRGTPNIVATTFVAHAFLDWFGIAHDPALLAMATAAVRYLNDDLLHDGTEETFYGYVPGSDVLVHNANILGSALTARVAGLTGDAALAELARKAAAITVGAQRPDGTWPYGRGRGLEWRDGVHTGYILDGVAELCAAGLDADLDRVLRRGFDAYTAGFFTSRGEPKTTPTSLYPIDIHCASTAVDVLSRRRGQDKHCLALARSVYNWTMSTLWDSSGFFYFRRHRLYTNRVAYVRWSQAHMFRALTSLLLALQTE